MLLVGSLEKKFLPEELPMSACIIVSIVSMINRFLWLLAFAFTWFFQSEHKYFWILAEKFFLAWTKTYISKFGGDLNKVTMWVFSPDPCASSPQIAHIARCSWGHSAGSLSVTTHLTTNPVNPPFKAAIFVRVCSFNTRFEYH